MWPMQVMTTHQVGNRYLKMYFEISEVTIYTRSQPPPEYYRKLFPPSIMHKEMLGARIARGMLGSGMLGSSMLGSA